MRTKELKTNKTMRTGTIFAAIAIITLIVLIVTFAKYASQGTGEDNARIAKWGLNENIPEDLGLFDAAYTGTDGKTTVESSDGSDVIAPGTTKQADITLATFTNDQPPEVMYHFEPSISVIDGYVEGDSLIKELDNLPGWNWTLGTNKGATKDYETVESLTAAVKDLQETDIPPNTKPTISSIQLGWRWDFDDEGKSTWDSQDTKLGNAIAQGALSGIKVILNLNAYQCQGCSGPKPTTPSPILKNYYTHGAKNSEGTWDPTIEVSRTTAFVPAFADGTLSSVLGSARFCDVDGNEFADLNNANTMASLSSLINSKGVENVYLKGSPAKPFYGKTGMKWHNAFTPSDAVDLATGLDGTFVVDLNNAGFKTIYFDENTTSGIPTSTGNWDYNNNSCPTLNGVTYGTSESETTEFYGAYKDIINYGKGHGGPYAWSSRASSDQGANYWEVSANQWPTGYRWKENEYGIILTCDFS